MKTAKQNFDFQFGLLHLVHLLTTADGVIDEREQRAIAGIVEEEQIPASVVEDFRKTAVKKAERDIYKDGLAHINQCTDEEKKRAFVHLFRLSEADDKIHVREVRLLLYSLKASNIDYEDVELIARLTGSKQVVLQPKGKSAA